MKVQFKFAGFKAQVVGKNKQAEANAASQPAQDSTQPQYTPYPNGPVPGAMIEVGELSGSVELSLEELIQVHTTKRELLAFVTEKWKISEFAETIVMAIGTKLDQDLAKERDTNDARETREQELHEAQLANTRVVGKTEEMRARRVEAEAVEVETRIKKMAA